MSVSPFYLPASPSPTDIAAGKTRATALNINNGPASGYGSRYISAIAAGGGLPGVIAEWGALTVFQHDDGTLTQTQVAALVAGLNSQQTLDQTSDANRATIRANLSAHLTQLETFIQGNPSGAVLTAAQTLFLAKSIAGLIRLGLSILDSSAST
jgi:hypothetical protein